MHVMLCLDDNNGMLFHHRRQSRDRALRAHMLHLCGTQPLWVDDYSAGQFAQAERTRLRVDARFLDLAGAGEFCFVEDQEIAPYWAKVEDLILFRWNRVYPADRYFALPPEDSGWTLCRTEEFAGFSHPKITKEVYKRCKKS